MKKLLLILLLLAFPLQAAWSAASAYCQHEKGTAAQHFGHHMHQHQNSGNDVKQKSLPGQPHADCSSCHLSGASVITAALELPAIPSITTTTSIYPVFLSPFRHERPERPKWFGRPA